VLSELGLPSSHVPYVRFIPKIHDTFRPTAQFACNTCGAIYVGSREEDLTRHLASPQHVAKKEEALARPGFSPAAITDETRRLDWVGHVRALVHLRNHFPPTHHLSSFLLPLTIRYSVLTITSGPTSLVRKRNYEA
jgi:hypothetical protein